jgi:hypothetical protein
MENTNTVLKNTTIIIEDNLCVFTPKCMGEDFCEDAVDAVINHLSKYLSCDRLDISDLYIK